MPLIGLNIVGITTFQALGKSRPSFLLSLTRQLLFLIPLVNTLPLFYNPAGVWAAFPASDFLSFLLTGLLLFRELRAFKESAGSSEIGAGSETAVSSVFE